MLWSFGNAPYSGCDVFGISAEYIRKGARYRFYRFSSGSIMMSLKPRQCVSKLDISSCYLYFVRDGNCMKLVDSFLLWPLFFYSKFFLRSVSGPELSYCVFAWLEPIKVGGRMRQIFVSFCFEIPSWTFGGDCSACRVDSSVWLFALLSILASEQIFDV